MLTSLQNPLVKQCRKLHQSKDRKRQRAFLLEGTHIILEACAANVSMQSVCFTQTWQEAHAYLLPQLSILAGRVERVSDAILAAIATTTTPDGVVAIAHSDWYDRLYNPPLSLGRSPAQQGRPLLGIAVETLQDPGNLGTIIRTGAAVGVDQLLLSTHSVDPTHPKVLRASAGQWFRVPMALSDNLVESIEQFRTAQPGSLLQVIATCPETNVSYWDMDYTQPSLILVGNEGAGLSTPLMEQATHRVQIPQEPGVESLNAAIATALVLYEAKRQRRIV